MRHRVGQIFLLIGTTGLVASGSGQELDQDDSPDYSTIFQQFLLQKIKEGDVWSNADYDNSEFPLRARQEDLEKATQIDEDLEDEDDDNVTETVINEAPYQMTSENGEISANIRLQQVFGSDLLTLLCRVTADDDSDLFSDKNCLPEVYLVAGQSDCENLPQEFSAKKLADLHGSGDGRVNIDARWTELPGKCLALLTRRECDAVDDDGSGDGLGIVVDVDKIPRQLRAVENIISAAGFGRTYNTLSLSSFNLISSATSSVFSISKPGIASLGLSGAVPVNVVATKYDKFSTLPYLQLTGWTAADAFLMVLFMMAAYLGYAYITAGLVSIEPLRQRFFNQAQLRRVDAINDGLSVILETYLMSLSSPWRKIASNIDRRLLRRQYKPEKNKFLSKIDKIEFYDPLEGY